MSDESGGASIVACDGIGASVDGLLESSQAEAEALDVRVAESRALTESSPE